MEIEEDGEIHVMLITGITINNDAVETLKLIDPDDHELKYSVLVRPYHNCLEMDSPDLGKLKRNN